MSKIALSTCLFMPLVYDLLPHGSEPTSRLPQQSFFLALLCLCGGVIAIPVLAFIAFVIGWIVYEFRKRRVTPDLAKSQAIVTAILSLILLVLAGCVLAALFFRDSYFL